jgi:hypothetical protein
MAKNKTLGDQLRDQAAGLAESLAPAVESAKEKAAPVLADAREKAGPVIADAKEKAGPVIIEARDRFATEVVPAVTAALASLDEATGDVREETVKRGKAVAAAIKGEVDAPTKSHKLRNLVIVVGLGGIAFAATKAMGRRQPTTSWQSSYTPPPAPTPPPASGPVTGESGAHRANAADDEAASDPAEAASDATDQPHQASSPDNPVAEVDIENKS